MPIEGIRASLNSDALKDFDTTISKLKSSDDIETSVIDFHDPRNFIIRANFNTKPYSGFVIFRDGEVAGTYCC